MWVARNRAHDRQTVQQAYRQGQYCVDEKARLRWRVAHHKLFLRDEVLLAPCAGTGQVNNVPFAPMGLTRFAVSWP